jgi:DNA-binding transcriptional LysR family regulator
MLQRSDRVKRTVSIGSIVLLYDDAVETRLLEYFVTVAEEQSVTAAAHRLFAAQSTVSAGLKSLERDLGIRLFERSTTAVALTPAGEDLLPRARALVDDVAELRHAAGTAHAGLRGRIRIGTFPGLRVVDLPGILGAFRRAHPLVDVRLSASPTGSSGLFDDLERDRLDLALTALPPLAGLRGWELGAYPFVALVPPSHPLASRSPHAGVRLAELADEEWVDVLPGYGNRVQVDAELARHGIARRVSAEVGELPAVPACVAAGLGVAVVPDIVDTGGCAVLALRDDLPPWRVSLTATARALRRPHVRALADAVLATR